MDHIVSRGKLLLLAKVLFGVLLRQIVANHGLCILNVASSQVDGMIDRKIYLFC
jgi:hypothetical protein